MCIYLRLSVSIYAHLCPSMSIHIHPCPSISIHIHPFLFISIYIHLYPSMSIYPSLSISIHLYPSLSIYIHLYPSISIYIHLYPSISIYIHLYPSISIYSICMCMYVMHNISSYSWYHILFPSAFQKPVPWVLPSSPARAPPDLPDDPRSIFGWPCSSSSTNLVNDCWNADPPRQMNWNL